MKKRNLAKLLFVLIAFTGIVLTGCDKDKDDDDDDSNQIDYHKVMTDYMEANSLDLSDMLSEWITTADAVNTAGVENYYIIDIRSATDFAEGHIQGAHNVAFADVVTEAENADKPILVVCYTGQSAAHALVALRLSGYPDTKSLKFGMSSWNADFDSWTANTGNAADGNANWSTTNTIETPVTFSEPEFTATAETGAEILAERVDYMLSEGFKGVTNADVLGTPTNYFINNYWTTADVDLYGHIVGAYRIKEDLTLANGGFENLDASSTVVTYCWTGQTSSAITAYLTVLGYDALSLKFGANGMIHDALQGHKWTSAAAGSYPYETSTSK